MNDLKTFTVNVPLKTIITTLVNSFIPAIITFGAICVYERCDEKFLAIIACVNAFVCLLILLLLSNILIRCKAFRKYKEYEGKWIQIIPEFEERPVSIIDFIYSTKENHYILKGINFQKNSPTGVPFYADKIVDRKSGQGFYYITNYTREQKNGLGKIGFIQTNVDDFFRAEGYFIDVSDGQCTKKYDTILIKYDKNFIKKVSKINVKKNKCISAPSDYDIYEQAEQVIEKEIQKYKFVNRIDESGNENDTKKL